jgi:hypothetical protein
VRPGRLTHHVMLIGTLTICVAAPVFAPDTVTVTLPVAPGHPTFTVMPHPRYGTVLTTSASR